MIEWKDIPGYENLYQASTDGQIRTCEGKMTSNARYAKRIWKQRIMKQQCTTRKSGHGTDARVKLWKDGKVKTHLVSRLVALTWCEGYDVNMTVNHIDGDPTNNHADNLEWISLKGNINHGFDTGLYSNVIQTTIVTDEGIEMKFRSLSEASKYLGYSDGYLSNLISKKAVLFDD